MPLHDSFKQVGQSANLKLAKMSAVPSPEDLAFALSLAVKNPKDVVELPWKSATSPVTYLIKVTCGQSLEEPRWVLHISGDDDQPVLWNYDTADTGLIHTLVMAECERSGYAPAHDEVITSFPVEIQLDKNGGGNQQKATDQGLEWNDKTAPSSYGAGQSPRLPNPESTMVQAAAPPKRQLPLPVNLDRAAVDSIYKTFTNPETGFISHAAFLFFLVAEFNRFQRTKQPFSVVRFEMCMRAGDGSIQALPPQGVREVSKRIFSVMRSYDWAAHYESEYALLLPFTNRLEAGQILQSIVAALSAAPLIPGVEPKNIGIFFGVACIPDDCSHPGILLAAAEEAKNLAKQSGSPAVLFGEAN